MNEDLEAIAKGIVDAAIKVHSALGPGLLESAYQACLAHELLGRGYKVVTEVTLPLSYNGLQIDSGYRIDMLVNEKIIIENKTVDSIQPIHEAQLLTYLKLSGCHIGFLLNWNVKWMKNGIRRMIFNIEIAPKYPKSNSDSSNHKQN